MQSVNCNRLLCIKILIGVQMMSANFLGINNYERAIVVFITPHVY